MKGTSQADQRGALAKGRSSYEGRAWDTAYTALAAADQLAPLEIDDLERLTWSAGLTGRDQDYLRLLERVYQAHLEARREIRAGRTAFWLGMRLFSLGEAGRAGGWLARAQRLIEHQGDPCVEQGYLLLPEVHRHFATADWTGGHDTAARAAAIGERFEETDLVALGRNMQDARCCFRARSPPGWRWSTRPCWLRPPATCPRSSPVSSIAAPSPVARTRSSTIARASGPRPWPAGARGNRS